MQFKITRHSGRGAPADAIELLWGQIEGRSFEGIAFAQRGPELAASVRHDLPVAMERDLREELARGKVLECLRQICEGEGELRLDWFAVGLRD
jgi:hypothetical protein